MLLEHSSAWPLSDVASAIIIVALPRIVDPIYPGDVGGPPATIYLRAVYRHAEFVRHDDVTRFMRRGGRTT
jgi:hypothetical protein